MRIHILSIATFFMFIALLSFQKEAVAVSAYPFPIQYKQPDGTTVTIKMKGDEKVHWAETTDGYTLLRNKKGGWEYGISDKNGNLTCSGILAKEISKRTVKDISLLQKTKKKLSYSKSQVNVLKQVMKIKSDQKEKAFPVTGTINLLMILVEFQDVGFSKPETDFENLMNQTNYNGTGCFKDFYFENSYGNLTINTTVAGVYTATNTMAYYGTNSPSDDYRVGELITEAVNQADNDVDFSDFDNDGDGKVDGIYVIYAGYGEEAGGGDTPDAIWAHASSIDELTLDGTVVSKYACSCELRGNNGTDMTAIGVICHEFGHSLGAPDYYDTNYDTDGQYPGTDQWDVMAGGSWNNDGNTPAQHNPYTKSKIFNWATATVINNAQTVTLRDIVTYPDIVQINTTTPNEYFLCENKQWTGFNYWVPGHGMIIYHVDGDYVTSHDPNNDFNAGAHQGMYVVSSSATTDNGVMENGDINTEDCPWPGTGAKTTFDDATTPSSKSWAGEKTEKPFTNIAENSGTITFDITFESLSNFVATPFSTSQIDLSWNNNSNNDAVMIAVNSSSTFGTPVDATTYSVGNSIDGGGTVIFNGSGASFNHTLLIPNTVYYYKAWSILSGNVYSSGILKSASTPCGTSTLPFVETFDRTTIPECWSQVDHQGNGQIWEFGTTSSFGSQAPNLANGNYAYLNSDNYGNGNTQNADLITPVIDMRDFSSVNIQFNHFHQFWDATNASATFSYSIDNGATWNIIQQWTESTTNPVSFNQNITEIAGQQEVKLKWNYSATYGGGWAIDDISFTGTPAVPLDLNIANKTVEIGDIICFDAQNEITVAGGSSLIVFPNGSNETLIAGQSIRFLPGFHAEQGCTMNAHITTSGAFCENASDNRAIVYQPAEAYSEKEDVMTIPEVSQNKRMVKIYPNPNNGNFTLALVNFEGSSSISIISTLGSVVYEASITNANISEVEMSHLPKGFYFVNVRNGDYVKTNKIVIH